MRFTFATDGTQLFGALLFAVLLGFTLTDAIKCYQCAVKPTLKKGNLREMKPPCQNFTPAAIYEVECGNSTYCMKQSYNFTLLNGNCEHFIVYLTHYNVMQTSKNNLTVIIPLSYNLCIIQMELIKLRSAHWQHYNLRSF
jgi:hypothetical protein